MPSDKPRLYVALYLRRVKHTYHWALIIGPKHETSDSMGYQIHVRNLVNGIWELEVKEIKMSPTGNILTRLTIAKIEDQQYILDVLRSVPVVNDDKSWTCKSWVKDALKRLSMDGVGLGTKELDWDIVHDRALKYLREKEDQGRWKEGCDTERVPTFNLLEEKETIK